MKKELIILTFTIGIYSCSAYTLSGCSTGTFFDTSRGYCRNCVYCHPPAYSEDHLCYQECGQDTTTVTLEKTTTTEYQGTVHTNGFEGTEAPEKSPLLTPISVAILSTFLVCIGIIISVYFLWKHTIKDSVMWKQRTCCRNDEPENGNQGNHVGEREAMMPENPQQGSQIINDIQAPVVNVNDL